VRILAVLASCFRPRVVPKVDFHCDDFFDGAADYYEHALFSCAVIGDSGWSLPSWQRAGQAGV
jgi:hypothetical protein